ncbi:MAG: hypothetical protein HZA31_11255, partial [Opitutae bacterium]|nr:hypothetical protein [Opitutae bacterium]
RINRTYNVFLDITNLFDEEARTDVTENRKIYYFRTNQGIGFVAGVRGTF